MCNSAGTPEPLSAELSDYLYVGAQKSWSAKVLEGLITNMKYGEGLGVQNFTSAKIFEQLDKLWSAST